jgi:hypothetical protein
MKWLAPVIVLATVLATVLSGCGLNVEEPDLFLLMRTGGGRKLTLLVNDSGTVRCNGGSARSLPDPLLLQARDLATVLGGDAQRNLRIPSPRNSVYRYNVRLASGTISFPDTAGATHPNLAPLELLAVQVAQRVCGLSG